MDWLVAFYTHNENKRPNANPAHIATVGGLRAYEPSVTITALIYEQFTTAPRLAYLCRHMSVFFVDSKDQTKIIFFTLWID